MIVENIAFAMVQYVEPYGGISPAAVLMEKRPEQKPVLDVVSKAAVMGMY